MNRIFARTNLIVLMAYAAACQTVAAQSAFEVASIKPSDAAAHDIQIDLSPGGLFTAKNVTVKMLIQQAYGVKDFQISGGPGWLGSERYDIAAKGDGPAVSEDEMRKMTEMQRNKLQELFLVKVRALLADRFSLRVHRETKELPVYELTVIRDGPKIRLAPEDGSPSGGLSLRRGTGGDEIIGRKVALAPLAQLLSDQLGRPVLDKTGLKESYDFKMTFSPDPGLRPLAPGDASVPVDTDGASVFTAVEEQLGLKLVAQRGPVEVVVIDSVQKPSAN
jgi:uncharacterized protein (TIGR03435 family)